jgi:hypothetical protein
MERNGTKRTWVWERWAPATVSQPTQASDWTATGPRACVPACHAAVLGVVAWCNRCVCHESWVGDAWHRHIGPDDGGVGGRRTSPTSDVDVSHARKEYRMCVFVAYAVSWYLVMMMMRSMRGDQHQASRRLPRGHLVQKEKEKKVDCRNSGYGRGSAFFWCVRFVFRCIHEESCVSGCAILELRGI